MKLLIMGAFKWSTEQIKQFTVNGFEVLFVEREDEQIQFDVSEIDVVICNWLFIKNDITKFKKLKCIQLLSAGLDRVPLDYIRHKGIVLYNARGVYSIPMAEFAVCGILQILKESRSFFVNQNKHIWEKNRNLKELNGKRVCVIGVGSVGLEIAKKLNAFTDRVYGVDLCPVENQYMRKVFPLNELSSELKLSDIVILTLPLTVETKGFFSKEKFNQMKEQAIFVNIARGELVDEDALMHALDEKLLGAVIDVVKEEPLQEQSPLWDKENLLITPHNSFVSENNNKRMWSLIIHNLKEFLLRNNGKNKYKK